MRDIITKEQAKLAAKLAAAEALSSIGRVMVEVAAMKRVSAVSAYSHALAEKEPKE